MGLRSHPARRPLFYALVFFAAYLTYLVISPFLVPLTWAAVFALMLYGPYLTLARKVGPSASALVITLLTFFLIVGPTIMIASTLARQLPGVAKYVQQASLTAPRQVELIWEVARARSPVALPEEPGALVQEGARRVLEFLAPRAGGLVADLFATVGSLVSMLFALFFMLRDGDWMGRELRAFLPLPVEQSDRLIRDTRDLVVASVGAGVVVAVAQGTIGAIAFWLLGLGSPAFWGVVTAFCSLVPFVGAAIVWASAALWLALSGEIGKGVTMLVVGVLGISMADNVLRPLLLSGRTSVSGFVIFFGLLGGVAMFGFIGLVIGPIILVITGNLLKVLAASAPE
jgi:predicted PurR-regulated permease PerM